MPALECELGTDVMEYAGEASNDYQKLMRQNSENVRNHIAASHSEQVKKIISLVPDGGNYKDLPEEYVHSRNFHVAWTRFASDKPAPTIDTGHRHHFHYKYNRVPTVRECARLQSFPEKFTLIGSESSQYRALGNAIPPVMFWYVANKISRSLVCKGKKYYK